METEQAFGFREDLDDHVILQRYFYTAVFAVYLALNRMDRRDMLKRLATLFGAFGAVAGTAAFPSQPPGEQLRYKVEGYAETRDAIIWVTSSAPKFAYGLSLDEVFMALEHGYQSVHASLKDSERTLQWEESREKMRAAYLLFAKGDVHEGKRSLDAAGELFTTLRRIGGKKVSRQELGDTEHGANELDE